jgi:hypothetical protein
MRPTSLQPDAPVNENVSAAAAAVAAALAAFLPLPFRFHYVGIYVQKRMPIQKKGPTDTPGHHLG